jgi:hypothetical protein
VLVKKKVKKEIKKILKWLKTNTRHNIAHNESHRKFKEVIIFLYYFDDTIKISLGTSE